MLMAVVWESDRLGCCLTMPDIISRRQRFDTEIDHILYLLCLTTLQVNYFGNVFPTASVCVEILFGIWHVGIIYGVWNVFYNKLGYKGTTWKAVPACVTDELWLILEFPRYLQLAPTDETCVQNTSNQRWKMATSGVAPGKRVHCEKSAGEEEIDDSWGEQRWTMQHGAWWKSPNSDVFGYKL